MACTGTPMTVGLFGREAWYCLLSCLCPSGGESVDRLLLPETLMSGVSDTVASGVWPSGSEADTGNGQGKSFNRTTHNLLHALPMSRKRDWTFCVPQVH